jgi:glycosyltransferase involved in cell wall biosynthesis
MVIHSHNYISAFYNNIFNRCFNWNKFGVDLYGGVLHENGLGDISRVIERSLIDNNINYTVSPLKPTLKYYRPNHYPINIIVGGADSSIGISNNNGIKRSEYTIGVWFWEIEDYFPWQEAYGYVDEIWVFSQFCYDIFKKFNKNNTPIFKMPYAPETNISGNLHLGYAKVNNNYGLGDHRFKFLFSFDYYGSIERKNPYDVVNAFLKNFKDNDDVLLIIKTMSGNQFKDTENKFLNYIKDYNNILYIGDKFKKEEFIGLIDLCDVYISLHSSEGLGIGMIEAMYRSKPVIATNYGGSTEFMNDSCAKLVDYTFKNVNTNQCRYDSCGKWASSNIATAAKYMKELYENKDERFDIANNARRHIMNNFNQELLNSMVYNRLIDIKNNLNYK